jgi:ribosome-binding factor A
MARDFQRAQRLSQQVHRLLAQMLRAEVRDPRLGFVTLTDVEVTQDLARAKVYFSLLDPAADREDTTRALRSAAGFLRSRLGEELTARTVPQLDFVYDETSERAARMDALLRDLDSSGDSPAD